MTKAIFAFLQIEQIKLEKILKILKIKAPSAKFTGLLDVLICDAFNKAYLKHHPDQIPLEYIHFTHAVNVRSKLGVKNAQLGHFSRAIKLTMKVSELTEKTSGFCQNKILFHCIKKNLTDCLISQRIRIDLKSK